MKKKEAEKIEVGEVEAVREGRERKRKGGCEGEGKGLEAAVGRKREEWGCGSPFFFLKNSFSPF